MMSDVFNAILSEFNFPGGSADSATLMISAQAASVRRLHNLTNFWQVPRSLLAIPDTGVLSKSHKHCI
jgi:hypothetical protein